jgi:hypothetical protein
VPRLEKLEESRAAAAAALDVHLTEMDTALESRALTPEERAKTADLQSRMTDLDARIAEERTVAEKAADEERQRSASLGNQPDIRVGQEPMTYGPENPQNSYYHDLFTAQTNPGAVQARARLAAHLEEVRKEAEYQPNTGRGKAAVRSLREAQRGAGESRAVTTAAGSDGALTPPLYLMDETAPFRTFGRAFIDQVRSYPLPETGMTFNVPKFTTPPSAQNQTAGSSTQGNNEVGAITVTDFVSSWVSGVLQTIVSNSNVSQQWFDRIGPGLQADEVTFDEQKRQVGKLLDQYALGVVLGTSNTPLGGTQAYTNASFVAAGFKQKVHRGKASIRDTDGTIGYPTHFFADASLWEEIEGSYDTANRPLVVPQGVAFNPIAVGDNLDVPEGYTGFRFAGVPAFVDHNQWIVWNTAGVGGAASAQHVGLIADLSIGALWLEGSPTNRVLPQPGAATLTVLLQTYVYCAFVPIYQNAFQWIYGTGTADNLMV